MSATQSPASTKAMTLLLYRSLLRTSRKFSAYNFREYALRRTRDAFRDHMSETDPRAIQEFLTKAENSLSMLKRQTSISQMYKFNEQVVESRPKKGISVV
ncbi:complex 1 protein-domain-containing protein [Kockiozyma suomiensis]|uniref:complex 1 protein-domain-containing protein n=1 Tax=Kockiozyma suomiensis TaxID=1337062 RepID=UPI0033437890